VARGAVRCGADGLELPVDTPRYVEHWLADEDMQEWIADAECEEGRIEQ